MERQPIRALIDAVDRVLWEVWDPIGVNGYPEARDEYTGYAPVVARMLHDGATDAEIGWHLSGIMVDRMGLSYVDLHQAARTLAALRALVDGGTAGV